MFYSDLVEDHGAVLYKFFVFLSPYTFPVFVIGLLEGLSVSTLLNSFSFLWIVILSFIFYLYVLRYDYIYWLICLFTPLSRFRRNVFLKFGTYIYRGGRISHPTWIITQGFFVSYHFFGSFVIELVHQYQL